MISAGLLAAIKILVSVLMVVILSLIAEWAGPRVAGIASGYPLGAAISLFFIGLELGPSFAARSAVFTAAGLAATVAFVGGYLAGLNLAEGRRRPTAIILAILPAMAAYGLTAWMLSRIPMTWISAPVIAAGSMLVAGRLFRRIPDAAIRQTIRLGPGVTLVRAAFPKDRQRQDIIFPDVGTRRRASSSEELEAAALQRLQAEAALSAEALAAGLIKLSFRNPGEMKKDCRPLGPAWLCLRQPPALDHANAVSVIQASAPPGS